MSSVSVNRPAPVHMPRFAPVAAEWFGRLLEVLHLARRVQGAHRERAGRIAEANALRRYANVLRSTDPSVAADLYAAADRHDWGL